MLPKRNVGRLVLLGPGEEIMFFWQFLARTMRHRLIAPVSNLPSPKDLPARALEKVKLVPPDLAAADRTSDPAGGCGGMVVELHSAATDERGEG